MDDDAMKRARELISKINSFIVYILVRLSAAAYGYTWPRS